MSREDKFMSRAFAGLAVLFWVLAATARAAGSGDVQRTVSLDARGTVSIETFKGSVDVETWDRPQAEVSARIEPDTTCGDDSHREERVRLTEVQIDSSPARLSIRSSYDRLKDLPDVPFHADGFDATCNAYPFVRYRLRVPRTARLEIEDHKSNIGVDGLQADARIQTHKGKVRVRNHDGAIELTTHKGDVYVEFARLAAGSRLETYKGDIEVAVPRSAGFDLDARIERGGSLDAPFRLDERPIGQRHDRIYQQKVNGGGPRLELSTRNGSLRITER
jgi:Putative adhesin